MHSLTCLFFAVACASAMTHTLREYSAISGSSQVNTEKAGIRFIRDLKCTYDNQLHRPLYCKWKKPRPLNETIKSYKIKLFHEGQVIYEEITEYLYTFVQIDLTPGAIYNVTVTPASAEKGLAVSTTVIFEYPANHSDDKYNLRIDGVGPDIVNVSWNGEEFLKNGVHQFRLVADPVETHSQVAFAIVNASDSKGSIATNLMPSTRYRIYIVEDANWDKFRVIQFVTTKIGANPGPVRKLRCNYKRSRKNILLCKWSEPEQPNGQIQYYSVKVAHGEELIYNTTEKKCRLKLEIDFKNDELYTVTISTVTYSVGAAVSTLVNFNHKKLNPRRLLKSLDVVKPFGNIKEQTDGPRAQITINIISGPVVNLKCTYRDARFCPLHCSWSAPIRSSGEIRFYKVQITKEDEILYEGNTTSRYIYLLQSLQHGENYNVTVRPVTVKEGMPASTVIFFENIGENSNQALGLKIDGVGSNIVNVSWNGEQFLKNGVHQIRLVAEPSGNPIPIADAVVNTSVSKGSITNKLIPSTRYMIYVEEISNPNAIHLIHYITTKEIGYEDN